jgi:hypothetical protein
VRPVLVLFGAALGVIAGMVLLAAVIFPGSPPEELAVPTVPSTPSDDPATPTTAPPADGPVIDPTTHLGGTLTVSGDRPGTFTLVDTDNASSGYTLAGSGDRITFAFEDDGTLFVDHVTYDGLDFYLDPGECEIEPGEVNTDLGISTVTVTCPEITDLRDTATVTVEGRVGVASTLTGRDDLPELGGSITVSGDVELVLEVEFGTWVQYPDQAGIFGGDRTNLYGGDGIPLAYLEAEEEGPLAVVGFGEEDDWQETEAGACFAQTDQLAVAAPDVTYHALTLDCAAVPLVEGGAVSIEGTVVVQRVPFGR